MLSFVYRTLTDIGAPIISLYLLKRRSEGREDQLRFPERFGYASRPRPDGRLLWCHAASVGEAASVLVLINKIRALYPAMHILITTGTVTSARMLSDRLPPGVMHQYMPVDRMPYVTRFLDHWRPDFATLIESELWPNMLNAMRNRGIPAALVNGRMSKKSFRGWQRVKGWAKELLGTFAICLTQTEEERSRFEALGASKVECVGNLKYAADPLPADDAALAQLKNEIGARPVWLMASSHQGEEELACKVHRALRVKFPQLLTIIAPRHAVRGGEVEKIIAQSGSLEARRSKKETITPQTEIYLADTMGELGLFYRLCPLAVIGGSFSAIGGHNPIEPAQLGCAIVFGPHMYNFLAMAKEFARQKAAIQLRDENELIETIGRLLNSTGERIALVTAARLLAEEKRHVLDKIVATLAPWLDAAVRKAA
jgi:3-deoxy-D-manno-octulosonic-acid transferase